MTEMYLNIERYYQDKAYQTLRQELRYEYNEVSKRPIEATRTNLLALENWFKHELKGIEAKVI